MRPRDAGSRRAPPRSRWRPRRCSRSAPALGVAVGCLLVVSDVFPGGERERIERRGPGEAAVERMGRAAAAALARLTLELSRGLRSPGGRADGASSASSRASVVERVLDRLEPLRDRPQAALEAVDVAQRSAGSGSSIAWAPALEARVAGPEGERAAPASDRGSRAAPGRAPRERSSPRAESLSPQPFAALVHGVSATARGDDSGATGRLGMGAELNGEPSLASARALR